MTRILKEWAWPVGACIVLSGWVVCTERFHRDENADSLIPALVSLQHWSPFFWGQDRYGMLVPLLARPLRDPLWNLLGQQWVNACSLFLLLFVLPRIFAPGRSWVPAGVLSAVMLLAGAPGPVAFALLSTQLPYGLSMLLCALGLLAVKSGTLRGICLSVALVSLASWINFGVTCAFAPFLILIGVLRKRAHLPWPSLGVLAAGFTVGIAVKMSVTVDRATRLKFLKPGDWTPSLGALGWNAWEALAPHAWFGGLAVLFVAALVSCRSKATRVRAARLVAAALGAGALYALMVGLLRWPAHNQSSVRYLIPSLLILQAGLAFSSVALLRRFWSPMRPPWIRTGAAVVLAAAGYFAYGLPDPVRVRQRIDRMWGTGTAEIREAGCTHIAGSYWTTWPAVFHASLDAHERGESRPIWGVAPRGTGTLEQWKGLDRSRMRVAVLRGDTPVDVWWERLGSLRLAERRTTIDVYSADP